MSARKNNVSDGNRFPGFPSDLFQYIRDLSRNNNQKWFHQNYQRYQNALVIPAKQFVLSIGEFITLINPKFETQPKFNKTLMRISRDARFAKGKPYRDYFLIGFHRWKWDSELFVYFDSDGMEIGIFINNRKKKTEPALSKFAASRAPVLFEVCDEYGIGKQYTISELGKEIEVKDKRFDVRKHNGYLIELPLIIISKYYSKSATVRLRDRVIGEAITHFSTLYPLWILSESPQPEKDLKKHGEKLGPVRIVT
jgi:hypothetical protein